MPRSKTPPAVSQNEADHPTSPVQHFAADESLLLDSGASLGPWQIAYQTYGTLNADKSKQGGQGNAKCLHGDERGIQF